MEKPKYHFEFGQLLSEGIKQTALARQESLQQTHHYLADELGYSVNALYVWRRGEHLPEEPQAVAGLARIFVKAWGADQAWIDHFLARGEYGPPQAAEKLKRELFGLESRLDDSATLTRGAAQTEGIAPHSAGDEPAQWADRSSDTLTGAMVQVSQVSRDIQPPQRPLTPGQRAVMAVANVFVSLFFKVIEFAPDWLVGSFLDRVGGKTSQASLANVALFETTCGDKGIDLAEQRLLVSTAFGAYFAGLLERDDSYVNLKGQVEVQTRPDQAGFDPIQSLYWALQNPKGPRLVIIAAEGGMGKSTLAAKLVRCLFAENAIDMILGDSAKNQKVDLVSGVVAPMVPGYYDPTTFFRQVSMQLGLPDPAHGQISAVAGRNIRDRLEGRRALLFVDNLETVARGTELLDVLQQLATRDCRVIVTTRTVSGIVQPAAQMLLVRLNPLNDVGQARDFLHWHIQAHAGEHPDLIRLRSDIDDDRQVRLLLDRTGGIPLLLQLVLSDVARFSWQYLNQLPHLFGPALLDFLYQERWAELESLGEAGDQARRLLKFVSVEQYRGRKITFERIRQWAAESGRGVSPQTALQPLQERFLIVNHDLRQGNFAIFPSLAEFLDRRREG